MMAFDPTRSPQDYIVLHGKRSPGIAEVLGASSPREWDEKPAYGVTGGFAVFLRRKLAHFTVRLKFYTAQDWADWAAWKPIVDKLPKRGPQRSAEKDPDSGALDIAHPILADLDIKAACVEDVGQPEQTDHGEWTVTIKFIEHRGDPKVTLAKPEGAKATPKPDRVETVIENLEATVNRLAATADAP